MNREQAKKLLPIIQAFAEGKTILVQEDIDWRYLGDDADFNLNPLRYRIKPEPKYRSFKDAKECWQEMHKHQPFGWVRGNSLGHYKHINNLFTNNISFQETEIADSGNFEWSLSDLFKSYTFADGTPFGIKED